MNKYSDKQFDVPILFIIFNRPDTTAKVFQQIQLVRPNKLYIAADGPRDERATDKTNCFLAREIINKIDWKCDVKTLFQEVNLGCGRGPFEAISWFFNNEEEGIILEDDCVPNVSFFDYCKTLLEKYRNDTRIMLISGMNHLGEYSNGNSSYHFSKALSISGWASWKRAWQNFDFEIKKWENVEVKTLIKNEIRHISALEKKCQAWDDTIFKLRSNVKISWWDYQWHFCLYANSGLGIVPRYNLISNIGFGDDATHLVDTKEKYIFDSMPTKPLGSEMIHPPVIVCDWGYDDKLYKLLYPKYSIRQRLFKKVKLLLKYFFKLFR